MTEINTNVLTVLIIEPFHMNHLEKHQSSLFEELAPPDM